MQWTDAEWYNAVPMGVNTLCTVVSRLCKMAGFSGYFTNHSLRATAATRLFEEDVDEQLVMAKTGFISTAVRSYKRQQEQQLQHVSNVVACKRPALSANPRESVRLPLPPPPLSSSLSSSSSASDSCETSRSPIP